MVGGHERISWDAGSVLVSLTEARVIKMCMYEHMSASMKVHFGSEYQKFSLNCTKISSVYLEMHHNPELSR